MQTKIFIHYVVAGEKVYFPHRVYSINGLSIAILQRIVYILVLVYDKIGSLVPPNPLKSPKMLLQYSNMHNHV